MDVETIGETFLNTLLTSCYPKSFLYVKLKLNTCSKSNTSTSETDYLGAESILTDSLVKGVL